MRTSLRFIHPAFSLLAALWIFTLSSHVAPASPPYLRVGIFVEEADSTDPGAKGYLSYSPSVAPGAGKSLRLFSDSNTPAALLVVAVDRKTRDLSPAWLPKLWTREEKFSEIQYPPLSGHGIPYSAETALDLYVVHIPLGFPGLKNLRENIDQIEKLAGTDQRQVFLLRAEVVRQQIEGWFLEQNKVRSVAQFRPPAKAATQRSGDSVSVLWREEDLIHKFTVESPDKPFVARIPISPDKSPELSGKSVPK